MEQNKNSDHLIDYFLTIGFKNLGNNKNWFSIIDKMKKY